MSQPRAFWNCFSSAPVLLNVVNRRVINFSNIRCHVFLVWHIFYSAGLSTFLINSFDNLKGGADFHQTGAGFPFQLNVLFEFNDLISP